MNFSFIFLLFQLLLINSTIVYGSQRTATSLRIFNKRNERNICPIEYQSCVCNYTTSGNRDININIAKYQALMVDCTMTKNFTQIPSISYKHSNRNYLEHVTQLELSHTNITEIQTEAFNVRIS